MTEQRSSPGRSLGVAGKAIIRRKDGRILLLQRSPTTATDPLHWDLPGGKMEHDENLTAALVREVREESGLDIALGEPFYVSNFVKEPFWITCITFICNYDGGEVELSDEHVDFAWTELSRVPELTMARAIREQLDAYVAFVMQRQGSAINEGSQSNR